MLTFTFLLMSKMVLIVQSTLFLNASSIESMDKVQYYELQIFGTFNSKLFYQKMKSTSQT